MLCLRYNNANTRMLLQLLGEGDMDYSVLMEWLKTRPDMPVLREEMNPATAAQDLAFMRRMQREVS